MATERPTVNERDIIVTLGANGSTTDTVTISRIGRDYQCIDVTNDGVVQIGLSQSALVGRFLYRGMGGVIPPGQDNFSTIELYNTSATPQTVKIQTSVGTVRDARLNLVGGNVPVAVQGTVPISGTVSTVEIPASVIVPAPVNTLATANHIDVAANANRKMLTVYNDSASDMVWVRDQGGTTSAGIPLGPKSMWSMAFVGAIRIRNNSGNPCDIYVSEIT